MKSKTCSINEDIMTITTLLECKKHIEKTHHVDGCAKAREPWKKCNCGKESILELIDRCISKERLMG